MKVLLLGCHSILEWDLMKMFTEIDDGVPVDKHLNMEIFSLQGAYQNPLQSGDFLRSIIPKGRFYQNLYGIAMQCDKDNIHDELIQWADVILMTHNSKIPNQKEAQPWLVRNWEKFEKYKKKVVWYSIGQSTPEIEKELIEYKKKGLKIVRYSPYEAFIPHYAGGDAIIRFGKDSKEFYGWTGDKQQVITVVQSFKKRGDHLGYHLFEKITSGFNRKVYGTENADLGDLWGGARSYEELKRDLREARVFWYFGTKPAPYTLSIIEAMMTGIPVVAVGSKLRGEDPYPWKHYEIPEIITNGANGFVSDNIEELRGYTQLLFENHDRAKQIGEAGRKRAIELFDTVLISQQWREFLRSL